MIKGKTKALVALALVCCFVLIGVFGAAARAEGELTGGSKGEKVSEVQRRLKAWGYYEGNVDGDYGWLTIKAVEKFQKKHGLTVTGIVDSATAEKIGISLGASSNPGYEGGSDTNATSGDLYLMARCIYGEARGEPYKGKVAVGAVILNRVASADFPNTVAGVIYQPGAFSVVNDGQINLTPNQECINAAMDAMNGYDPTGGCVFYYNPDKTDNKFMHSLETVVTIGAHRFAK